MSLGSSQRPPDPHLIDEEVFYNTYKPITNPRSKDDQWEMQDIDNAGVDVVRVWTAVTGDNNSMSLVAGIHYVNRLYYMVTEEPWPDLEAWVELDPEHDECSDCGTRGDEELLCPDGYCEWCHGGRADGTTSCKCRFFIKKEIS